MHYTNTGLVNIFDAAVHRTALSDVHESNWHHIYNPIKQRKLETHKLRDADIYDEWPVTHPQPEVNWE